jgi:hypothetical protein
VDWASLRARVGRRNEEIAFIYVAEVGLFVEHVAYGLNPGLPQSVLESVLLPEPIWLGGRHLCLREAWPKVSEKSERALVRLALLSCKAMLGLGAAVPDGRLDEMKLGFDALFPAFAEARRKGVKGQYDTGEFHVAINAVHSHETWFGCGPGRNGRKLPIVNPNESFSASPQNFSNWEVAMKNLLRLDLQARLEDEF